jgi:predicted acyltransferase
MNKSISANSISDRDPAIDQFRGLAILLMVLANYLAGVKSVPAWLKHAPDIGLTTADLIAPFFIFAIGLTYGLSWNRRKIVQGKRKTFQHFFTRFMAMIGIGAVLSAGEIWLNVDNVTINWGVLQAIGVAGFITLIVIDLPLEWRTGIAIVILAGYQYMLDRFWLTYVLQAPHGGLPGAISWGGMLMLATVLADLFHNPLRKRFFLPFSLFTLAAGIVLSFFIPISKNRVSISYVLISLSISAIFFYLINQAVNKFGCQSILLRAWGKNPITLYILHLLLIGAFYLPDIPAWYSQAATWLVALQAVGLIGILSVVALWLEKRNIFFSL